MDDAAKRTTVYKTKQVNGGESKQVDARWCRVPVLTQVIFRISTERKR